MNIEQERAALKPCPFCGHRTIFTAPDEIGSGGQWVAPIHVGCNKCKAEQVGDDEGAARANWNRRAALQSQSMPPEISRDLLGRIIDQVFGGAIEDATVIEDIYRVIACEFSLQSQDREGAAMAEIVREAAQIIAAIPPEHAPDNIRWPIIDELEGFASKIDHARRVEGEGK